MIKKYFLTLFLFLALTAMATKISNAANLQVRLEQPKSPTNQNNFGIKFVAMDILDRVIVVKCFKKGPGEAAYSQFGDDQTLLAGGNTGSCDISPSLITANGTYEFYVQAAADSETTTSQIVSVDFNVSDGPGTPTNYQKDRISNCDYKISFRTADDGGKTVKVEIYRSDTTNISVNSSSSAGSVNIGSNQDGSITNSVPDCTKDYYYVLRAFDAYGNASSLIGDSTVKTIVEETTTLVSPTQGAIAVTNAQISGRGTSGGEVAGEETAAGTKEGVTPEEETGGTGSGQGASVLGLSTTKGKNIYIIFAILGLAIITYAFYQIRKKR